MSRHTPTNKDVIVDSRDVIERIEELEAELENSGEELNPDDVEELAVFKTLAGVGAYSPDWEYGATLIRDSYFRAYAQELAQDLGRLTDGTEWPHSHIDWDLAVEELQSDYIDVDFDGVAYWIGA